MKKFMIAALAAGMLTACSDSAVVETPAGGGAQWGADGTGYVSLSINLPKTTSAGRANDNFDDGNANEWAVNDAILVLFTQGNAQTEGEAQFQAAYQLPVNFNQSGTTTDQITATAQITKRIQAIDGDKIKALVILNGISSGAFKCENGVAVDDKDNATLKYVKTDDTEAAINIGTTFSDFQAYTSKISTNAQKGLLMLNAPLTDAQSATGVVDFSGKKVSTLSEIIADNIKNTAAAAADAPAANIYVERAVAKVTMSTDRLTGSIVNGNGLTYTILGIALDNTNPTSYLVRNADLINPTMMALRSASPTLPNPATGYRMVGNETVGIDKPGSSTNLYRTYFAKSTNYDGSADLKTETATASYTWTTPANVATSPLFCMENTFPVDQMFFDNTTRAILKVKIDNGIGDRYILHNWDNAGDTWCTESEMLEDVRRNIAAMSIYTGKTISNVLLETTSVENVLVLAGYQVNGSAIDVASDEFKSAKARIGDVYKYVDGIAYYEVRIQHFGDDLTPWNKDEYTDGIAPKEGSIDTIYPTGVSQDGNYLGRYGVLRNNWYNLTVNSVKRVGTPFIPKVKNVETPDDVINSYISVNINILSWAKRDQGVDLQ
ncbi:fimbria major subunit [Prevotellamassilia timonensis]|uniref:fimbria major subunit n=1 Tax=Prevotellamassilia timonensis TaxID=1852370 RepID=UPI001F4226C7|nr:fimbria major subunit [Prevotellamassilia timonensis]MCF2635320.1 Mfa1 fimbrilin C-terminal domain-containing protein [Prevotellamassilia timonensis]